MAWRLGFAKALAAKSAIGLAAWTVERDLIVCCAKNI